MTRNINITDSLFAAISRANELLEKNSISQLEFDSLTAHVDYIKLNEDNLRAGVELLSLDLTSVNVTPDFLGSADESPEPIV